MTKKRTPSAPRDGGPPLVASPAERLRPWLLAGMMALWVARPLFPSESATVYGDGHAVVLLWLALAALWLLASLGRPTFSIRFGAIDVAVLLLVGWQAAAAIWAVAHGAPRPAVNTLWEWVGLATAFLLARQCLATPREGRTVAAVMIALAVGVSCYGLYQRTYEFPRTRALYETDPDRALRDAGLWFPPGSPERKLFEDRLHNVEPTATFALTNSLAGFLAPWIILLIGIVGEIAKNRKQLVGLLVLLTPLVACLLLTKSRSGYIAACVGLLLAWQFAGARKRRFGWKLPAAAAAIVVATVVAALVVEGPVVLGRTSKSFGYRLQYWQSSLRMIADHPWLGCGPGNFQDAYTQYKLPEASEEVSDPHNFLLELGATAGLPAALAFLGVLGCFAWQARVQGSDSNRQSRFSNPSPSVTPIFLGGGVGFLLAIPLGMLSAAPPGMMPIVIGLPAAALTVAALWRWIQDGQPMNRLAVIGVVVLLIALSAGGGINMPGLAGSLWLLIVLGIMPASDNVSDSTNRSLPGWTAWAALAGVAALLSTCYGTGYRPVLTCQAEMRRAEESPETAIEHLEAAAAADPLAVEPRRRLAAALFDAWRRSPSRAAFERFEQADAEGLRRAPNSAPAWLASGDWYFEAATSADARAKQTASDALGKATAAYRQAVRLYPTSALAHAKLAETNAASGDRGDFRREAAIALQLDKLTPHYNKKLPPEIRERLRQTEAESH